jgi:hypothetical protein
VIVNDINDNSPSFPLQHVELRISEVSAPGTTLQLQDVAEDADSGARGVQNYHLEDESSTPFRLVISRPDSDAGPSHISLALTERLDYEQMSTYNLKVWIPLLSLNYSLPTELNNFILIWAKTVCSSTPCLDLNFCVLK